jgi:hypothetical protein
MRRKSKSVIVLVGGALAVAGALWVQQGRSHRSGVAHARNACIANLRQIQGAMEWYSIEKHVPPKNRLSIADISGGKDKVARPLINVDLTCPMGGTYSITTVGEPPRCSVPGHSIDPPPE